VISGSKRRDRRQNDMTETVKKKVLTVGDGDLSLSLALTRAYGEHHIDLTASVFESDRREFLRLFPEAPLNELQDRRVSVMYGVDATQLYSRFNPFRSEEEEGNKEAEAETLRTWDLVSFHHPHLGVSNLEEEDEAKRAIIHHRLLCHYFHSAGKIAKLVHVCLTATQPTTWKLMEAAKLQNLTLVKTFPDTKPFANIWTKCTSNCEESDSKVEDGCDNTSVATISSTNKDFPAAATIEPHFAAPRRYRNGKLGRHWLSRYGYRHRRTEGVLFKGSSKDANVSESIHFVFATSPRTARLESSVGDIDSCDKNSDEKNRIELHVCPICKESFASEYALRKHLSSPVENPNSRKGSLVDDDHRSLLKKSSGEKSELKMNVTSAALSAVEPSKETLQQPLDPKLGTVLIVSSDCQGERLRRFLQNSKIENIKFSKRLAQLAIQAGLVLVNGEVARDSSRILKVQDSVTILEKKEEKDVMNGCNMEEQVAKGMIAIQKLSSKNLKVEIVERSSDWLVALKPSGMRTKGNTPGTLESSVSEQEGGNYSSISSLETSCSGLCVLANTGGDGRTITVPISIRHFLTVLVHGQLPKDEWFPSRTISLKLEPKWRRKKKSKKRKHRPESKLSSSPSSSSLKPEDEKESSQNSILRSVSVEIYPTESTELTEKKTPSNNLQLSTLQVVTPEPSLSSICHYLRLEGFPVVGDSFCKQEYSGLKRSIRNRLKNKLCIGCFKVEITARHGGDQGEEETTTSTRHVIEIPSPDKLSALFWETFLDADTAAPRDAAVPSSL